MTETSDTKTDTSTAVHPELIAVTKAKLRAEAKKVKAEARKARAEAQYHEACAVVQSLKAEKALEDRRDELAGDVNHHRYVFSGEVAEVSVKACIRQLTHWVRLAGTDPVTVEMVVNSPGGDIVEGFVLIDFIRQLRMEGHTINMTALGMAASMAGALLQAASTRIMGSNAVILIHEAKFMSGGSVGNVEDRLAMVKMLQGRILDLYAERAAECGAEAPMTREDIENQWHRKDWWIPSEDALRFGFVDDVI